MGIIIRKNSVQLRTSLNTKTFFSREFQTMAIDLLSLCYTEDRRRTSLLLVRKLPDWGNVTCLDLAAAGRNKQFIAHVGVQNLLSQLWMGRLSRYTGLCKVNLTSRSLVCWLLPISVFIEIEFYVSTLKRVLGLTDQDYSLTWTVLCPLKPTCSKLFLIVSFLGVDMTTPPPPHKPSPLSPLHILHLLLTPTKSFEWLWELQQIEFSYW